MERGNRMEEGVHNMCKPSNGLCLEYVNNSYKSIGRQTVQQEKNTKTHTSTSKINYKLKKNKGKDV